MTVKAGKKSFLDVATEEPSPRADSVERDIIVLQRKKRRRRRRRRRRRKKKKKKKRAGSRHEGVREKKIGSPRANVLHGRVK